jgi:hypothetical protein
MMMMRCDGISDVLRETMRIPCAFHVYPLRILCVTPDLEGTRVIAKIAILADTLHLHASALALPFLLQPVFWHQSFIPSHYSIQKEVLRLP